MILLLLDDPRLFICGQCELSNKALDMHTRVVILQRDRETYHRDISEGHLQQECLQLTFEGREDLVKGVTAPKATLNLAHFWESVH